MLSHGNIVSNASAFLKNTEVNIKVDIGLFA